MMGMPESPSPCVILAPTYGPPIGIHTPPLWELWYGHISDA